MRGTTADQRAVSQKLRRWKRAASNQANLIVFALVLALVFTVVLVARLGSLAVAFGIIEFGDARLEESARELVNISGLPSNVARALLILAAIPFVWSLWEFTRFDIFRRFWGGRDQALRRPSRRQIAVAVAMFSMSGYFLLQWTASRNSNFSMSGDCIRYYAETPAGVRWFDRPGFDPKYGIELACATPEVVLALERGERGLLPSRIDDTVNVEFFDTLTGKPTKWYFEDERGRIELFSSSGFHPVYGEPLKQVDHSVIKRILPQPRRAPRRPMSSKTAPPDAEGGADLTAGKVDSKADENLSQDSAEHGLSESPTKTSSVTEPARVAATRNRVRTLQRAAPSAASRDERRLQLLAGHGIHVRLIEGLSTRRSQIGAEFTASLAEPIVAEGVFVAKKNALVKGRVVESHRPGRVTGRARLSLILVGVESKDGQQIALSTVPLAREAKSTAIADAKKVGIAGGIGAVVGGVAGGRKGAATGAAIGGAARTVERLATRGKDVVLKSETLLSFQLADPVLVRFGPDR